MNTEEEKALLDQAKAAAEKLLGDLRNLEGDLQSERPEEAEGKKALQNAVAAAAKVLTILRSSR